MMNSGVEMTNSQKHHQHFVSYNGNPDPEQQAIQDSLSLHNSGHDLQPQPVNDNMQQQLLTPVNLNTHNSNDFNVAIQELHSMDFHHNNQEMHQQHGYSADSMQQLAQQHSTLELHPNVVLGGLVDIDIDERPHQCEICLATYKTRTHLRRHTLTHLQSRPFPCSECSKGFNRKEHLNKHIQAVHSKNRYKCEMCGKEISRKDHLARHIKHMHGSDLNESALQAQLNALQNQVPLPSSSEKSQPEVSEASLKSQDLLRSSDGIHFMMGNSADLNADTNAKPVLRAQPQTPPKQKISTEQEPKTMSILDQLKQTNDLFTMVSDGGKKTLIQLHSCQECNATFSLEKDFNIHLRVHRPQPYRCHQCPRAYTRREKLSEHIRCFHEGQKFTCEYCDKQLSRKDHVLRHVRSVHPEVLANRFVAIAESANISSLSGIKEISEGSFRLSGNSSQGNSGNSTTMPSMGDMGILLRSVCHLCLKVFGTSYHLARHVESCHNGDNRPFSCGRCKKKFKRKDHLSKHSKLHCKPFLTNSTRSGNSKKLTKNSTSNKPHPELSTIDQETINSLQIEMTPDEDVEVALAIVNNSIDGTQHLENTASTSDIILSPSMTDATDAKQFISTNALSLMMEQIMNSTSSISSKKVPVQKSNNKRAITNESNNSINNIRKAHSPQKPTSKDRLQPQVSHHSLSSSNSTLGTSISNSSNDSPSNTSSSALGSIVQLTNNWKYISS